MILELFFVVELFLCVFADRKNKSHIGSYRGFLHKAKLPLGSLDERLNGLCVCVF